MSITVISVRKRTNKKKGIEKSVRLETNILLILRPTATEIIVEKNLVHRTKVDF